ncbi:MAG: type II toxin-antitoxin system HicA family toxin [Actinobacteria bacterium]|nr:type II toxin-antitoxin system HicA family toxin [Actinomycetota bacterium]MCL5070579.1 type II toxin-antitoxin system HicA family toxin [Actinomycetota bacterium]
MKIPRDTSSDNLIQLLKRYDYKITRQTGSHIRLTSSIKGKEHHITIPKHKDLKIGTLNNILNDISKYLEINKEELIKALSN